MDESGIEDLGGGTSHFVLLGMAISSLQWKRYDRIINQVKSKYDLSKNEIHAAWMARRYVEQNNIMNFNKLFFPARRAEIEKNIRKRAGIIGVSGDRKKIKNYRKYCKKIRPYIHLTLDERKQALVDLATEMGK